MWQNKLYTPDNVVHGFQDWLSSQEGQEHLAWHRRIGDWGNPSLLDIVATWLAHEDNILWLPDYDVFMAGLVLIINEWLDGDKKYVDQSELWLDPETGEPQVVEDLLPQDRYDHELEIGVGHSLLNRSAFDGAKAIAHQKQQHRIEELLTRLTPGTSRK